MIGTFPGGPVVKNPSFHCSSSGSGNSDPSYFAAQPKKTKKYMIKVAFHIGRGKDQLPNKEYLENWLTTGKKEKKMLPSFLLLYILKNQID